MTIGYVITEVGYEYNDEIYSQNDGGAGNPIKIYLDKAKAEEEVKNMNMDSLFTCDIGDYAYDLEDIITDMDELKKVIKKYDTKEEVNVENSYELGVWFSNNNARFSKEDKGKMFQLISLDFYNLVEVEIDDSVLPPKEEKKSKNKFSNLE